MYRLRNYILCALASVLLFFAAAGTEAAVIAEKCALNPETYQTVLRKNDVYGKVHNEIKKHFESEENATGIPAEVYLEAVTPEFCEMLVNDSINSALAAVLDGREHIEYSRDDSFAPLRESVEKFFSDYAESINYKKDDVYRQKVDSVCADAEAAVLETADVFQFSKIEKAGYIKTASRAAGLLGRLMAAVLVADAVLLLILVLASIRKITGVFYWLSISFGSVSVVMLALGIWLKTSDFFSRFAIKASHIFSAITGTCIWYTDLIITVNAVLLAVSVLFMIIFAVAGKEKKDS